MRLHANEAHLSEVLLPLAEVSVRVWNAKYRLLGAGGDQSLEDTWPRVARVGGDEFVIVQTNVENPGAARALARKLVARIRQPYNFYGVKVNIKTSVGIALFPQHGNDPEPLLTLADRAMYKAKKAGGNGYRFFDQP